MLPTGKLIFNFTFCFYFRYYLRFYFGFFEFHFGFYLGYPISIPFCCFVFIIVCADISGNWCIYSLLLFSIWILFCLAWCDFCSSDQRFASTFLQIPLALITVIAVNRTPLVLAVSFPLLGRIWNFHPLATCAARRTKKNRRSACFHAFLRLYD